MLENPMPAIVYRCVALLVALVASAVFSAAAGDAGRART
jgi:hypothetical protein